MCQQRSDSRAHRSVGPLSPTSHTGALLVARAISLAAEWVGKTVALSVKGTEERPGSAEQDGG